MLQDCIKLHTEFLFLNYSLKQRMYQRETSKLIDTWSVQVALMHNLGAEFRLSFEIKEILSMKLNLLPLPLPTHAHFGDSIEKESAYF